MNHFQRSGTVADLRNTYLAQRGRDFSQEKVRRVKKVYARRQKVSLRRASHSTNVTRYFVAKILKKVLKKKPFKSAKTEKLTASQKLRRLTLCKKLISLPRLTNMLKNVWFTDESCFYSDGIAQKNKAFYWALSKDAVKPTIFQKYPIKVHVWAAVSVSGLIGPYFFHKDGSNITVNQYTYQDCIRWFICQLKLQNKFSKAILMQDGATPHTALSTRTFLRQQFKDRIIGKTFYKGVANTVSRPYTS